MTIKKDIIKFTYVEKCFAVNFLSIKNNSVRLEFLLLPLDGLGVLLLAVEDGRHRVPLHADPQLLPAKPD